MTTRRAIAAGLVLASSPLSACAAPASDAAGCSAAIGSNARTEEVDALGFAIVVDGTRRGRVVGTLLNTEGRPHALTGAAIKSEEAPVRAAVLADVVPLPPGTPVDLVDRPPVSVPASNLSVGSFVELTLDVSDGELVEMLVPVVARQPSPAMR